MICKALKIGAAIGLIIGSGSSNANQPNRPWTAAIPASTCQPLIGYEQKLQLTLGGVWGFRVNQRGEAWLFCPLAEPVETGAQKVWWSLHYRDTDLEGNAQRVVAMLARDNGNGSYSYLSLTDSNKGMTDPSTFFGGRRGFGSTDAVLPSHGFLVFMRHTLDDALTPLFINITFFQMGD